MPVEHYIQITVIAIVGGLLGAMTASSFAQSQYQGPLAAVIIGCVIFIVMSRPKKS